MNYYGYPYIALTGGTDGSLDSLDGSLLKNGDFAVVVVPSTKRSYVFTLDEDSGATDDGTNVIAPDSNAGLKRWVRTNTPGATQDVSYYGAVGDGITDDTAAIQAALDAVKDDGGIVKFDAKPYLLSSRLSCSTSATVVLSGVQRGATKLIWTDGATNGGGISITYANLYPPAIDGMSLLARGTTGKGLELIGVLSDSVTRMGPSITNLLISGENPATDYWADCAYLKYCWFPHFENIGMKGLDDSTSPFDCTSGVTLYDCQAPFFHNFVAFHVENAILEASGTPLVAKGEGFQIQNFEMVGVTNGIVLYSAQTSAGSNIGPGHINAYAYGIKLSTRNQVSIHDMLIYKCNLSSSNFVAIELDDCPDNHIHDNIIRGDASATGDNFGIVLSGTNNSKYNHIHDNKFIDFYDTNKFGVLIGTGADLNFIHHNYADETLTQVVHANVDAGPSNIVQENYPTATQGFTANDATPSVGNDLCGMWATANNSPTTITMFHDGYVGQQIKVIVNDAVTTFDFSGTNIRGNGGVDWAAGAGDWLEAFFDGVDWYCAIHDTTL